MAEPKTPEEPSTAGVQNLIDRIRDEGVEAGQQEAEKILQKARADADAQAEDTKSKPLVVVSARPRLMKRAVRNGAKIMLPRALKVPESVGMWVGG